MVYTYILYNAILIVACSFAYFAEHGNGRLASLFNRPFVFLSPKIPFVSRLGNERSFRRFCRFVVFLALFFPASLRYGTGADYFGYVDVFNNINISPYGEIGWVLLNKGIHFLGLSSQWIFVFSSFLLYFPVCFFIKRKNYFFSILFYIILGFYFRSFNVIRQYIAVSFLICAVTALEFKKNLRFFIWVALASLFHTSALFILPFFPLKYIKIKRNVIPLILTGLGIFFFLKFNIFHLILSFLEEIKMKYSSYKHTQYYTQRTHLGTGLGVLVKMLPSLLAVFMAPFIIKKYPQKAFLVNLSIVYIWSFFLSAQFTIMGRARDLFIFVPILITGFAIQTTGKYKKFIAVALISLNLLMLENDIRGLPKSGYARWMNPYYSIFSDLTREEIEARNAD